MKPVNSNHPSENVFAEYLTQSAITFERDYPVDPGNVDFLVSRQGASVLCDVKAVVKGGEGPYQPVGAKYRIREDIKKLCQKFRSAPSMPLVLVTLNYSSEMFTAYSVQEAMLGDVEVGFVIGGEGEAANVTTPPIQREWASLRQAKNTRISGVLVIDPIRGNHCYIGNPYAANPLPAGFFPVAADFVASLESLNSLMVGDNDLWFLPTRNSQERS